MLIRKLRSELKDCGASSDLTPERFLSLPQNLRRFLWWIVLKRAVTLEQTAAFLGESEEASSLLIQELDAHGLVEHVPTCGFPVYRVCLSPRRLRPPEVLVRALGIQVPQPLRAHLGTVPPPANRHHQTSHNEA